MPPFTFDASTKYTVQVTATVGTVVGTSGSSRSSSASAAVSFQVGRAGVLPVIAGGDTRTVSSTDEFLLDGSGSRDIDFPTNRKILTYSWTCIQYSPIFGKECNWRILLQKTATNIVKASMLSVLSSPDPTVYQFTLSLGNKNSSALAVASTLVTVTTQPVPVLSVGSVAAKYNPDQKITVNCSIAVRAGYGPAYAKWYSPEIDERDLASMMIFPPKKVVAAESITSHQLVLSAGSLSAGVTYSFQLTASYGRSVLTQY